MMDCKKALVKAAGDFVEAEKILKQLGLATAAKRAGRATTEGRIFSKTTPQKVALIQLSCETDFVAKSADFIALGEQIISTILLKNILENNQELNDLITDTISRIKENITLRRFSLLEADSNEFFVDYIHGEGKIGVIVKIKVSDPALKDNPDVKETAFDTALHVAAYNPVFISKDAVDQEYLNEQEKIFKVQAEKLGKPEKIIDNIVRGKMKKHFSEICLLEQVFVKNDKMSVSAIYDSLGKNIDGNIEITDFLYYKVGEEL